VIRGSALRCVTLVATAATALLAGCTTSGHPESARTTLPVSISATTPSDSTPATTPAPTSAAPSSPPAESTEPATSSTPTSPSATPTGPQTTCTELSVRVILGGAAHGEQIAGLQFVNEGASTCVLAGYPTVSLLLAGRLIGQPSIPSGDAESLRRLRPGEVAESLLHDYTQTCQAPLSDSVRVQVPGRTDTVIRPDMQLRACVLRVDPLGPPD
jgi:hypothetical protein